MNNVKVKYKDIKCPLCNRSLWQKTAMDERYRLAECCKKLWVIKDDIVLNKPESNNAKSK